MILHYVLYDSSACENMVSSSTADRNNSVRVRNDGVRIGK